MKKCAICVFGSWTVGLAAVGWAILGVVGDLPSAPIWSRAAAVAVGLVGVSFLYYQPPLRPCPRCVRANRLS